MRPIKSFDVRASLPESLEPLREIAYNLWWYWNISAIKLFYRLNTNLWEETNHNPVDIIGKIPQSHLEMLATDEGTLANLERVKSQFESYMNGTSWYARNVSKETEKLIAYFSLEFGLAESIPIYSGGLGVLAGDHLKSASDLGIPLVGMGILYQEGYFRQYLNNDGWQQQLYINNDFYNMPLTRVLDSNGEDLKIEIDFPGGPLYARVWKIQTGRVPLYLLDTNIDDNTRENRTITSSLYGGDQEMRLKQEMLLGIGGLRALHAMDIWPTVCHMNEGHAAFLSLERIRTLMEMEGLTFNEAFELASAGNVFTTHTPVAAGHDRFPPELMLRYFESFIPELGLTRDEFLALGRVNPKTPDENFTMTVLALKTSDQSNAVSRLHMQVSREMWKDLWPDFPLDEVPIAHVTNGIHVSSWVSQDMVDLFDRYVGPKWRDEPASLEIWNRVNNIPDEEIWRTHERRRERLVSFVRRRLQIQLKRQGASDYELNLARGALNSKALTIGFARRFATYKRGDLIFRDLQRLSKILKNPDQPVQIIIAGKAHPRDDDGKDLIRRIIHYSRLPEIKGQVVFVEDYDLSVARYLLQGVDVWLNTPRRPLEASGTSGMKAAANGAINLSILDGWWDEAYTPEVGWAIGSGEVYDDPSFQDTVESNAIYNILEKDLAPLFYNVEASGLPRKWIEKMKQSMSRLVPIFNTHRMVHEYYNDRYRPAIKRYNDLKADKAARAAALALWKQKILENWSGIRIIRVDADSLGPFKVGDSVKVTAMISLGNLAPQDVCVELFAGMVDASGLLFDTMPVSMEWKGAKQKGQVFEGALTLTRSGKVGYSLRILPCNPDMFSYQDMMLIKWA
ncbi:MAG: alpha-glucan family phosphorylase [Candidatus Latescibacter sp.]|nr:alpha-glucan family phosphorylase [Candidatus Latescibacter sp.]